MYIALTSYEKELCGCIAALPTGLAEETWVNIWLQLFSHFWDAQPTEFLREIAQIHLLVSLFPFPDCILARRHKDKFCLRLALTLIIFFLTNSRAERMERMGVADSLISRGGCMVGRPRSSPSPGTHAHRSNRKKYYNSHCHHPYTVLRNGHSTPF